MDALAEQDAERRKAISDQFLHDVLDPLFERPKSIEDAFKKMADSILSSLEKIAEKQIISELDGAFSGRRTGGGGSVGGPLGRLSGFGHEFGGAKASNGGLASGAGTIADATASMLQQGRGGADVTVNIINQGTPPTVDSSGSSGDGQLEQMVISLVLKDADTLGPMSGAASTMSSV